MNLTWYMQQIDWECDHRAIAGYVPIENDGTSVAAGVWAEWRGFLIIGIVLYGVFNGESITNWYWKGEIGETFKTRVWSNQIGAFGVLHVLGLIPFRFRGFGTFLDTVQELSPWGYV